ncbi:MAG: DUF1398 family protein [Moraxellaceae bacterium]|nr:DUF1398 family protein [Moraxellaceae bacterium]
MDTQTRDTIERCAQASSDGTASFGQIVQALLAAGVESYHADYRGRLTTYYLPDGDTLDVALPVPDVTIGQQFDATAVQVAIRGSQRGEVKYPEFKRLSMTAGCIGYTVWLAGRHVSYYGRRGDTHVEHFPS